MTDSYSLPESSTVMFPAQDTSFTALAAARELGAEEFRAKVAATGLRQDHGEEVALAWARCRAADGEARTVVVRALDTEPGAATRTALLAHSATTLVEGAHLAALAVGAERVIFAVASDQDTGPLEAAVAAVAEASQSGASPSTGAGPVAVTVSPLRAHFMHAQDIALVRHLEQQPAMAALVPPTIEERGLEGQPTVVHSTEVVANLVAIANGHQPVQLWQVHGEVAREGLVEVAGTVSLRALIDDHCGGMRDGSDFKYALVGGATGRLYAEATLDDDIAIAGLGVPTVVVEDQSHCPVDTVRQVTEHLTKHNCGRCIPCLEGSYQLAAVVTDLTRGRTQPQDEEQLREVTGAMAHSALCAACRDGVRPVLGLLELFPEEFAAHKRKNCPSLTCSAYVTFHILGDKCTGCEKCVDPCPEDCIDGDEDYIHVIDPKACTSCGICFDICPDDAIVKAGPKKPKTPKKPVPVGSWKKR